MRVNKKINSYFCAPNIFYLLILNFMEEILFLGLNLHAWITIVTVLAMFTVLAFTKLSADVVFMGAMTVLYVSGVLSMKEALAGFSSESVVTIGVLFVVIAGLMYSGVVQWIVKYVLGSPSSYSKAVIRLMAPVAALSSFLSNTSVVALFLNVVKLWAKKLGIAPSRLLIPLSYASCLGGACTLIGTPPNLIISGFYAKDTGVALNIFVTLLPGLFCLLVGILAILAMKKLLPERKSAEDSFQSTSDYTVELLVPADCPHIGQTVSEAALDEVKGGRLIEILRFDKEVITPVPGDEFIMGGDRLVYSGRIDEILELKRTHKLVNATEPVYSLDDVEKGRKVYTASIDFGCPLIGSSISATDFEQRYGVVLVAVSRRGERIEASPREISLRLGDVLLLECPSNFKRSRISDREGLRFFDSEEIPNIGRKTLLSSLIMLAMLLLSTFNVIPLLQSCLLAAFAMLITRCCSIEQAQNSINWNVLMIFAGSVCLGTAIEKSGIAVHMAEGLLSICGDSPLLVLIVICTLGTFITEFISNTACAAMFYPIAYHAAISMGVNPLTFCIGLMLAVSSSFATPIGSPTHMLVYSVGGYRFTDFMKIGIPMNIIILAANIFIVTLLFPL